MRRLLGVLAVAVLIGSGGCAATQQAKSVEKSGFMDQKTYSMLKEGKRSFVGENADDQPLLIYVNPNVEWKKYKKVHLDPVTVFVGKDSPLAKVKPEDRKMLANVLFNDMHEALSKDYEMTRDYDPDTLWIQFAITEADESSVVLDTISSIIPQTRLLSGVKSAATGVGAFTGAASAEMKVTNAATGELLAAGVDRRGGTKSLSGVTDSWHDITEAYRYWSEKVRYRLCKLRGGVNCIEPKA